MRIYEYYESIRSDFSYIKVECEVFQFRLIPDSHRKSTMPISAHIFVRQMENILHLYHSCYGKYRDLTRPPHQYDWQSHLYLLLLHCTVDLHWKRTVQFVKYQIRKFHFYIGKNGFNLGVNNFSKFLDNYYIVDESVDAKIFNLPWVRIFFFNCVST